MIFKDVNSLNNNSEKKFFKEQIDVFIRLIEVCCEKNNIEYHIKNKTITETIEN